MDRVDSGVIWSFLDGSPKIQKVSNSRVRKDAGYPVSNYLDLAARIAELQFRNRGYVLLFRGQDADHKSAQGLSTMKPTIFRPENGKVSVGLKNLQNRYNLLEKAEGLLVGEFKALKRLGRQRVERQRLLRWSILQHYEVCDTPLLDVSQSLRIAASFASLRETQQGYVYALAIPNISGAITASAEAGLQIVRLASVCPPSAIRPHIQEGYLLGEYPDFDTVEKTGVYKAYQVDVARRLIGKFRFDPKTFWRDPVFPRFVKESLYPTGKDWLENAVSEISETIKLK